MKKYTFSCTAVFYAETEEEANKQLDEFLEGYDVPRFDLIETAPLTPQEQGYFEAEQKEKSNA